MRVFGLVLLAAFIALSTGATFALPSIYSFQEKTIEGKPMPMSEYKGKVIMVVNVASKCGYAKQYPALEALYEKYKSKGFVIVGFPANNFQAQEPGTNAEIHTFCTSKYNVTFPMSEKISVLGTDQTPIYQYLTTYPDKQIAGPIVWNFTKFLVDRKGKVTQRFDSKVTPDSPEVVAAIEKALNEH